VKLYMYFPHRITCGMALGSRHAYN
jgi:hypothetical protein